MIDEHGLAAIRSSVYIQDPDKLMKHPAYTFQIGKQYEPVLDVSEDIQ